MGLSSYHRIGAIVRSCQVGRRSHHHHHHQMQSQLQHRCICTSSSHPNHHNPTNRPQNALFNRRSRYNALYNQITIRSILLFGHNREEEYRRPWHDPDFMKNDAPDQVEAWLLSLLKSSNNNIEKDAHHFCARTPCISMQ